MPVRPRHCRARQESGAPETVAAAYGLAEPDFRAGLHHPQTVRSAVSRSKLPVAVAKRGDGQSGVRKPRPIRGYSMSTANRLSRLVFRSGMIDEADLRAGAGTIDAGRVCRWRRAARCCARFRRSWSRNAWRQPVLIARPDVVQCPGRAARPCALDVEQGSR